MLLKKVVAYTVVVLGIALSALTLRVRAEGGRIVLSPDHSYESDAYVTEEGAVPSSSSPDFYEFAVSGITAAGGVAYAESDKVTLSLVAYGNAPTVCDPCTLYNQEDLGASIQHGGLILEKRVGDERAFHRVGVLVNLFEDNPFGIEELYVFSSQELHRGITLRVTVLYATKAVPPLRHSDVYEIRVLRPETHFCLSAGNGWTDLDDGGTVTEGNGILCEFGRDVFVEMSYNGGAFVRIPNGTRVDLVGQYRFRTEACDGTRECKTVYIIPSADDAPTVYFPMGVIQGIYIFDEASAVPTYLRGATLTIPEAPPFLPALTGRMVNHDSGEIWEFPPDGRAHSISPEEGDYTVTLTVGNGSSGITDLFTFRFHVWESYGESVNHTILKRTDMTLPPAFTLLRADTDRAVATCEAKQRELIYGVPLMEQLEAGEWVIAEYRGDVLLDMYGIRVPDATGALADRELEASAKRESTSCRSFVAPRAWFLVVVAVTVPIFLRKREEDPT